MEGKKRSRLCRGKSLAAAQSRTETSAVPTEIEMEDPLDFFLLWDKKVGPLYFYVHK